MQTADVRCFLFGEPGSGGFDLMSLNVQRGRDHGLPDYNTVRADLGLLPKDRFLTDGLLADNATPNGVTSDPLLAGDLEALFISVDNVDVFVGGLAEDPFGGSPLSEVLQALWVDQFTRLRDGDAFYYARPGYLSAEELAFVEGTRLADIILRNTSLSALQDNVFLVPEPGTVGLLVLGGLLPVLGRLRRRASC